MAGDFESKISFYFLLLSILSLSRCMNAFATSKAIGGDLEPYEKLK
jgi:hypothetical protein